MEKGLNILESISLTRLPDESFRGIVNFIKANRLNASMTEIEKALVSLQNPLLPKKFQLIELLND